MKYQELMKEVEGVGKLKLSEQENFYRDVLNESSNDLEVMVAATFYLGMAYYYEGNFNGYLIFRVGFSTLFFYTHFSI